MKFVIFICLIAIFLAFLEGRGKMKYGLAWGFVLVTIVQALRYDYGPDYLDYYNIFENITWDTFSLKAIFGGDVYKEPGWALLNYLFKPLGFFALSGAVSIFENIVYYNCIKSELNKEQYFIALAIYLFTFNFYFVNMSMLRQGLAVAIGMLQFRYIKKSSLLGSFACAIIASLIHTSAVILFLTAMMTIIKKIDLRVLSIIFVGLFFILWASRSLVFDISNYFLIMETFEEYSIYGDAVNTHMGIGYFITHIPFYLLAYFTFSNPIDKRENQVIFLFAILGMALSPFASNVHLSSRLFLYFDAFSILALPKYVELNKNKFLMAVCLIVFFGSTIIGFNATIHSPSFYPTMKDYTTIFSVL